MQVGRLGTKMVGQVAHSAFLFGLVLSLSAKRVRFCPPNSDWIALP